MSQASQLSPELARGLLQLARAFVVAVRSWTLYLPEHPTVSASASRLAVPSQIAVGEAAALLHDRGLIRIASRST
jgi:hypothetical protein